MLYKLVVFSLVCWSVCYKVTDEIPDRDSYLDKNSELDFEGERDTEFFYSFH